MKPQMKSARDQERRMGRGLRRTPQRQAILRYLEGNHGHPSAGEIFEAVRGDIPGMSFATVYNTLERLRAAGEVKEVNLDPKRRRFDPEPQRHHHVLCVQCGEIRDVRGDFSVEREYEGLAGYEIHEAQIEFFGLCPNCRERR